MFHVKHLFVWGGSRIRALWNEGEGSRSPKRSMMVAGSARNEIEASVEQTKCENEA